jgi:multidrug resistance efflux pump
MSNAELKPQPVTDRSEGSAAPPRPTPMMRGRRPRIRVLPILITLVTTLTAAVFVWAMWQAYMAAPWTRDGTVRVYVVTMAPEVAGHIVELPVADNQFVHKGDLLMTIDPTNYEIAVHQAEAAVEQAKAVSQNAQAQAVRRAKQTTLSVSVEEKQIFASQALSAAAALQQALANLDQARVTLRRTRIVSPVNGYVTNLQAQLGDYVNVGDKSISVVNADSFWVDGYFEETQLGRIHDGDPATIKLMGYRQVVRGHVDSVARGIDVANAQSDSAGLASVNPIFTWVRLAQRVPVRIHIDTVPDGVRLTAGMTATVQIDDDPALARSPIDWLWHLFGGRA